MKKRNSIYSDAQLQALYSDLMDVAAMQEYRSDAKAIRKVASVLKSHGLVAARKRANGEDTIVREFIAETGLWDNLRRRNPSSYLNSWGDPVEFYKLEKAQRFMIEGRRLTTSYGTAKVFAKAGPRSYWDHTLAVKSISPRTMVVPYLGVVERI